MGLDYVSRAQISQMIGSLPPSGSSGLILGLIFGLNAGLTIFEPPLMLARFFRVLLPLSCNQTDAGVAALAGEAIAEIAGLVVRDEVLFVDGGAVLMGLNFGVFFAASAGAELRDTR